MGINTGTLQGAALAAYRQGLKIAEALAVRDPSNVQWLADVVVSCAKLGLRNLGLGTEERRQLLQRGMALAQQLQLKGHLSAAQRSLPDLLARGLAQLGPAPGP